MMKIRLWISFLAVVVAISGSLRTLAHAESTVIDGPGFKLEKKKGWFGSSENTYHDAFGNAYVKKQGLFGRHKTDSSIFGSKIHTTARNTTVEGPNGQPMITEKHTWFHGNETHVNGNGIWQNVKDLFNK